MADDPDDTDSQRRRRHWGDDRRALVGQRRKITGIRGSLVQGVPVVTESVVEQVHDYEDRTPVFDRIEGRPLTEEDGAAIMRALARVRAKLEDRSESDRRGMEEVRKLLAQPPPTAIVQLQRQLAELAHQLAARVAIDPQKIEDVETAISGLKTDIAPIKRLGQWAAGIAFSALVAVGIFLYSRGTSEGGDRVRLERLQRDVEELQRDVRVLERHGAAESHPAPHPPSPGPVAPDALSANIKDPS